MSRLEQRAVSCCLTLKNLSVPKVATKLQGVYGTDALKYSTVSKWRLRFQDGSDDLFDLARSGRPSHNDLVAPIQPLLQQCPFISCNALCRKLKIGKETCLRVLHDDLHLEKFNLCYVPHSLEADQKRSVVQLSREPVQILEPDQQYEFEQVLTEAESWFFSGYFHHSCSAANPDDVPEIPSQKIKPKSASFRLFGVAQRSKVCCMFRKR
jgi:transposase